MGKDGSELSTISTTASSTSRSNSARISVSFSRPAVCASCSSCFMRAREDLEARDSRTRAKEKSTGMRIGNRVYKTFFFKIYNSVAI